jgi:hypothetical protein
VNKHACAFYFDCDYEQDHETIIADIERYWQIYVIGYEKSKVKSVKHAHVLAWGTKEDYDNYRATILKKKYKLRGRAQKDLRKQYGKVSIIKNIDNMVSYTIKHNNFHYKGVGKKYMLWRLKESYIKKTNKDKYEEIIDKMINQKNILKESSTYIDVEAYRRRLVCYLVEEYVNLYDLLPSRNQIQLILYKSNILTSIEYAELTMGYYIKGI